MHLVFGWEFDGGACPETSGDPVGLGFATVGPRGLVDVLERWLGLVGPAVPESRRIARYHRRIRRLLDEDRGDRPFFAASFETDAWATAAELLRWRDELVLGGWQGEVIEGGGNRLEALARLEDEDGDERLDRGWADRLADLRSLLERETAKPPITRLDLATPIELLPPPWSHLLEHLERLGVEIAPLPADIEQGDSDLGKIRRQLSTGTRQPFDGDGTVALLEANDPIQAADIAAGWLSELPDQHGELVIVRGTGSIVLDEALRAAGLPKVGGRHHSALRGVLQLLPLVFELVWKPLDPERLLEFLLVPGCPIPRRVAWQLARALGEEPGVGGPRWQEAWEKGAAEWRAYLEREHGLLAGDLERRLEQDRQAWRAWIEDFGRHDPTDGIPHASARKLGERLRNVLLRRAAGNDDPLPRHAGILAETFLEVLASVTLDRIPRSQLGRMIDAVLAEGVALPESEGEAAGWTIVDTPGQIWAPVDTVLWWDFRAPDIPGRFARWSKRERDALQTAGIELEGRFLPVRRMAHGWRSTIRNARARLLLVRARNDAGEATDQHPLWDEIAAGRDEADLAKVRVRAEDALSTASFALLGVRIEREPVPPLGGPRPIPQWKIGAGLVQWREVESASGITALFGCPLAWVLRYVARVRPGELARIPEDRRVAGNLAHRIIAKLLSEGAILPDPEAAGRRACELFEEQAPEVAASLLLPGKEEQKSEVRQAIVDAAGTLVSLLSRSEASDIACEVERSMPFREGTKLEGRLDLVCTLPGDRRLVLDLKWTDKPRYREEELGEGRPVQLATYRYLEALEHSGRDIEAGLFLLKQARCVFPHRNPLGDDPALAAARDLTEVWQEIQRAYAAEMERLREGSVHATGKDMGKLERPLGMQESCGLCDYGHLCGVRSKR